MVSDLMVLVKGNGGLKIEEGSDVLLWQRRAEGSEYINNKVQLLAWFLEGVFAAVGVYCVL